MDLKAGFAEIDITPPVGTHKIGWLKVIVSDRVLDPLYARAAVLAAGERRVGFIQTDTLFTPADVTAEVRRRIEAETGFPGSAVMVAATHNHAGPAVDTVCVVRRDEPYVEGLIDKLVAVFAEALAAMAPAELGFASAFEFGVAHNRRVVMRDGTARCHESFRNPQALRIEGPIDPEVAVLAVRRSGGGGMLGAIVNFACHPTHHGGDGTLSAGFPGMLAAEMKARGCPVTLFLQGPSGNTHTSDPARGGADVTMEQAGKALAADAAAAMEKVQFTSQVRLAARSRTLRLPFRELTDEQIQGTVRGAQRFVDPALYDRTMPELVERIRRMESCPAEVQVLFVNDVAFAAVGAEYFVEFGLAIKERTWPTRAVVVSCANDRLGYVPTREAFARGGYETTFGPSSCLGPDAGYILADAAVELVRQGPE